MPRLVAPRVVFFDWHGTLADTFEAMYRGVDDLLAHLDVLGLAARLIDPGAARLPEHATLVQRVGAERRLPAQLKEERRLSRTEIFEILFGADEAAKSAAHEAYDDFYSRHFRHVHAFEPGVREMLEGLRAAGLGTGMLTNRRRGVFARELSLIERDGWAGLFDVVVCGDDVRRRKPAADMVLQALDQLSLGAGPEIWFVGDSTTDTVAAKEAGITSIYYNGARWAPADLVRIFPGACRPDAIAGDFAALEALALSLRRSGLVP
jgi:phosphoglycolate phosphatase